MVVDLVLMMMITWERGKAEIVGEIVDVCCVGERGKGRGRKLRGRVYGG